MNYRNVTLLALVTSITSCSSLNKQVSYSAASGAAAGAIIGKELSPDRESDPLNMVIGLVSGALAGGALGYLMYQGSDPTKDISPVELKESTLDNLDNFLPQDSKSDLFKPNFIPISKTELDELQKKKLKQQGIRPLKTYIKEYKTKEEVIFKNGKRIVIPSHTVIEQGVE